MENNTGFGENPDPLNISNKQTRHEQKFFFTTNPIYITGGFLL